MSETYVSCNLSFEQIKDLAGLVGDKKLECIKIKNGDCELTIEAERACPPPPFMQPMAAPFMQQSVSANEKILNDNNTTTNRKTDVKLVKSPVVGTYYASSSPDKPPFVTVGKHVSKGDVLMIIESMKLMNEIQSEYDGTVEEILVKNGDAVEFDQPIMIIK